MATIDITKLKNFPKNRKTVNYGDDMVVEYNEDGKVTYNGWWDYAPVKELDWNDEINICKCWDSSDKVYRYNVNGKEYVMAVMNI